MGPTRLRIELIYLMSHLSSAEAENAASNSQQLEAFKALRPFFARRGPALLTAVACCWTKVFISI